MGQSSPGYSRRAAFTLVELLVVIAIIGILVALLLPAIQAAREAGRRSACSNNLKQIGLALQEYHDVNNIFPSSAYLYRPTTGGQKGAFHHTWLTSILPFMEQKTLHDSTNLDGNNGNLNTQAWGQAIVGTQLKVLLCPSGSEFTKISETHGIAYTTYAGTEGFHWWPESHLWKQPAQPWNQLPIPSVPWDPTAGYADFAGLFAPSRNFNIAAVKDGTANTIAVAECDALSYKWGGNPWDGSPNPGGVGFRRMYGGEAVFRSAFLWTQYTGYTANEDGGPPSRAERDNGGATLMKCDDSGRATPGWFRSSPHSHPPTYICAWNINNEWPGATSAHTGGVLLASRVDGSVGTYNENILYGLWVTLNGVADGGILAGNEAQR